MNQENAFPTQYSYGLSKREWYAGMAIGGVIAMHSDYSRLAAETGDAEKAISMIRPENIAKAALEIADALIKELNNPQSNLPP